MANFVTNIGSWLGLEKSLVLVLFLLLSFSDHVHPATAFEFRRQFNAQIPAVN